MLNLLTPEKVLEGVAEVKAGRTFCLSLPLDHPGGDVFMSRRLAPVLRPTIREGAPNFAYQVAKEDPDATDVSSDDLVILHTQYSTQWDSFAHMGQLFDADGDGVPEPVFYNGYRAGIDVIGPSDLLDAGSVGVASGASTTRVHALGIEKFAERGMQGRGVLIDLHAHFGDTRTLVGYDLLMDVLEKDDVVVEAGDMVCFHTGFAQYLIDSHPQPDRELLLSSFAVIDGRDAKLLNWISDTKVAAIAADNFAVEAVPARPAAGPRSGIPLHEHCLFKLGVPLAELWYLTELATWLRSANRSRFLLTAPPLRLPGAVGSPTTPIATV